MIDILDKHIPSLTTQDDRDIDDRMVRMMSDERIDNADMAIRTCACGQKIDGFYEYVDHLKEVFRAEK